MSANRTSALKCPETNPRQCTLDFAEDSYAEQGLDVEQDLDIEQSSNWGQSSDCERGDRKSTRLNSSHQIISYAVFCLKKKTRTAVSRKSKEALMNEPPL